MCKGSGTNTADRRWAGRQSRWAGRVPPPVSLKARVSLTTIKVNKRVTHELSGPPAQLPPVTFSPPKQHILRNILLCIHALKITTLKGRSVELYTERRETSVTRAVFKG